jgi:hypothetical protein
LCGDSESRVRTSDGVFSEGDPSNRRRTTMDDAAGWQPDPGLDPDAGDRERPWEGDGLGDAWADEVRPPDHVPQLHKAMSEAAEDLGAVEDRLSTLFERTEGPGPEPLQRKISPTEGTGAVTGTAAAAAPAGDDEIFDLFEDGESDEADDDVGIAEPVVTDRRAIIGEYEDDIGGDFAELDAELAAEEPDEPAGKGKRRKFRRRAKGPTAARR